MLLCLGVSYYPPFSPVGPAYPSPCLAPSWAWTRARVRLSCPGMGGWEGKIQLATATLPSRLIPPPPTCPSGQWGGGLKPPPRRLDPNIYFLININAHKSHPCRAHNRRDRARLLSLSHTCVPPPFCRLLSAAYKTSHSPPYPYATLHSTTTNNQPSASFLLELTAPGPRTSSIAAS